ncbi:MAG: DUF423 domain-containing protein [bacterium]
MANHWLAVSGVLGGAGVGLGAFGAHALRLWLPLQKITIFETAVRYHLLHALALFGTAILLELFPDHTRGLGRIAALYLAGVVLFSGGLYGFALTDQGWLAWLAPFGAALWVVAWFALAWIFLPRRGDRRARPLRRGR